MKHKINAVDKIGIADKGLLFPANKNETKTQGTKSNEPNPVIFHL
jgi:hypothetical protein